MLNILKRPKAYLAAGFLFYTIYHLYAALELFVKDLPNNHIIKRAVPLVNFLQGTTATFEKPPVENMYGPVFNLIMHPVVVLSDFQVPVYKFVMIYTAAISVLILLMTLFFCYARGFSFSAKLMVCLLVLNFQPLIYDVQTTMPELWQLAFVLVGIVAYKKNSFFWCGFCLAAAALIKVYPLFLIFLFLLIRKRVFFWGVVSLVILLGITQFLYGDAMGVGYVVGLVRRLSPDVGDSVYNHGILAWDGIAFKSMLLKWVSGFRSTPEGMLIISNPEILRTVSVAAAVMGIFILVILTVFYLRIRRILVPKNLELCEDFLISMGCLYPLLFGPNSAFEYLILSFPAFLLLLQYLRQGLARRYLIGALAAYFLLTGIIMPNTLFLKLTHFNEIALFFLPQVATRQPYEIYRFLGMHQIGLLSLTAAWFILLNRRIAGFKKEEKIAA